MLSRRTFLSLAGLSLLGASDMGSGWENPGPIVIGNPAGQHVIISKNGILLYDSTNTLVGELSQNIPYTDVFGSHFTVPGFEIGAANQPQIKLLSAPAGEGLLLLEPNDGINGPSIIEVFASPNTGQKPRVSFFSPGPINNAGLFGDGTSGVNFYGASKDGTSQAGMYFAVSTYDGISASEAATPLKMEATDFQDVRVVFNLMAGNNFPNTKIQFGNGPLAAYYQEEVTLPAQVIATGATTALINLVASKLNSDYGSAFALATGIWTCPDSGEYVFTFSLAFTTWVAASSLFLDIARGSSGSTVNHFAILDSAPNQGRGTITAQKWFAKNDTATFGVFQNTGANRTIETGTERSYISIRRAL